MVKDYQILVFVWNFYLADVMLRRPFCLHLFHIPKVKRTLSYRYLHQLHLMTFIQVQFKVEFDTSCEPAEDTDEGVEAFDYHRFCFRTSFRSCIEMRTFVSQNNPRRHPHPRKKMIFSIIGIRPESIIAFSIDIL